MIQLLERLLRKRRRKLNSGITLLIGFVLLSCTQLESKSSQTGLTPIATEVNSDSLITMAIDFCDTNAYNLLSDSFLMSDRDEELFFTSFTVSNKCDYWKASLHVYFILNGSRNSKGNIENLDSLNRHIAINYLRRSYNDSVRNESWYIVQELKSEGITIF